MKTKRKTTKKVEETKKKITAITPVESVPTTIYKSSKFNPKFCDMLVQHMSEGYSYTSFAGVVGVTRMTLNNWRNNHPDFREAFNIGMEKGRYFWEKLGMDLVTGLSKGSARAWEINMFNRFREDWKLKTHDTNNDGKPIEIKLKYDIPSPLEKNISKEEAKEEEK